MADHHDQIEMDGPFPGGWLWAVVAALVSAALARWIGAPIGGAVVLGLGVFVVYAVLLGQFWQAPASGDHDHGHDHGHGHGHDDHGHDDHGHGRSGQDHSGQVRHGHGHN